jgi:hypothetical protein
MEIIKAPTAINTNHQPIIKPVPTAQIDNATGNGHHE